MSSKKKKENETNGQAAWAEVFTSKLQVHFCPTCNSIMDLPSGAYTECTVCGFNMKSSELQVKEVVTRKTMAVEEDVEEQNKQQKNDAKATINETCPECGHGTLYFTTAQTRSADEGQTVFYECPNCEIKWTLNT